MKVKILYHDSWNGGDEVNYYPVEIEILNNCPQCGGPRGSVVASEYREFGHNYTLDNWENPCGHIDTYEDAYRESERLKDVSK